MSLLEWQKTFVTNIGDAFMHRFIKRTIFLTSNTCIHHEVVLFVFMLRLRKNRPKYLDDRVSEHHYVDLSFKTINRTYRKEREEVNVLKGTKWQITKYSDSMPFCDFMSVQDTKRHKLTYLVT